ncbi:hypothetical protein [Nonomuraea sp. NPDC049646]|uniref:hypothetical protein n=1 Tax=unclassified Nonomuraea TaxID=2593643 RepID=UPI003791478A
MVADEQQAGTTARTRVWTSSQGSVPPVHSPAGVPPSNRGRLSASTPSVVGSSRAAAASQSGYRPSGRNDPLSSSTSEVNGVCRAPIAGETRARAASRKVKAGALTPSSAAGRSAAQYLGRICGPIALDTGPDAVQESGPGCAGPLGGLPPGLAGLGAPSGGTFGGCRYKWRQTTL